MAGKGEYFTQVLHKPCQQLVRDKVLTHTEGYFLFCLLAFLAKDTNLVINELNSGMNVTEIANLVGLSRQSTSRIIKSLENKGLLTKEYIGGVRVGIRLSRKHFINGNKQ